MIDQLEHFGVIGFDVTTLYLLHSWFTTKKDGRKIVSKKNYQPESIVVQVGTTRLTLNELTPTDLKAMWDTPSNIQIVDWVTRDDEE